MFPNTLAPRSPAYWPSGSPAYAFNKRTTTPRRPSTASAPRSKTSGLTRESSRSTQSTSSTASETAKVSSPTPSVAPTSPTPRTAAPPPAGPSAAAAVASSVFPTPTATYRDSFVSIVDDPFFQRYDPAFTTDTSRSHHPVNAQADSDTGSSVISSSDEEASDSESEEEDHVNPHQRDARQSMSNWPPPRRESLRVANSQYRSHINPASAMESYNIAVIGATGAGKSSFVQRVLGLQRPPISNASSARMVVDNVTHMITLLELDLEYFELNPSQPIQWPKQINGHIVPRVDAALILYDVMNEESIRDLPQTVVALTKSGLPAVLVACKTENPEDDWEVDADAMEKHDLFKSCIGTCRVSADKPELARGCLQIIIKAAVAHRRDETGESGPRRRAQSTANIETSDSAGGPAVSEQSKHSRASSDLSLVRGFPNPPVTDNYRKQSPRNSRQGIRIDRQSSDAFLDVDESDADSRRYSDDIPILQRSDENVDRQSKVAGISFDDLVDRLLAPRLTRADNNFSDVFLCLYRKFAAPGELFSAILTRLDRVRDDKSAHYLSKTATQLRIIEVVAKWVALYPGDFARPTTRKNLNEFIKHLSTEPIFSIAAHQMRRNLRLNVVEDDDTGWANADDTGDQVASEILSKEFSDLGPGISALTFDDEQDGKASNTPGDAAHDRNNGVESQFQFHSYDEYEKEAIQLEPTDHLPMNKFRYHIFMDIPDDDVADELTRIDWIMFSSIRIRDFVRHVSLSSEQKEKCKSLKNVNRMINHFNHVAQWVANMVLLRDKPKHRAQILEKFMNVALKLRQLNNYNGLAAVLAGINGTAIHRLAQTRALVPTEVQKRFARLVILMGTQKSHFAYRLAWENSPLPRIPFIPLHRRDLVSAEEGSKTFVGPNGDRVNWKKFEVLGEVLLPIMKSQGTAYPNLVKHDPAREMILGCRMPTDDEEIYQRSVQVESTAPGPIDPAKKKFPWFAK